MGGFGGERLIGSLVGDLYLMGCLHTFGLTWNVQEKIYGRGENLHAGEALDKENYPFFV